MKVAIIDLGTNTFHLLIAEMSSKSDVKILFRTRAVVKLGKNGFKKNEIAADRFKMGIRVIQRFYKQILFYKVDKTIAYATSAIRKSSNGEEFVGKVRELTGIRIKVISGDEEAELIYNGIRHCVELDERPVLMMDIGGGSTEFIIANKSKIFWKKSFDIGASRLLEQFKPSNPITIEETKRIQKYLREILKPLQEAVRKFPVSTLAGSSGSFETLAEMIAYRFYNKNILKGKNVYQFRLSEYFQVHDWLLKSTTASRMKTKGLIKMRVDMIVISSICVNYILKKFKLKEMILSKFALKEGALWRVING